MNDPQSNNPLNFLQGMWNQMGFQLPGMVTPTLDEGELDKQIKDLKSVENWLRMNLSMLQMTIQNLEMQKSALGTFRTMGEQFTQPHTGSSAESPFSSFFQMPPSAPPAAATAPEAPVASTEPGADEAALTKAAMWPWEMMHELNAKMQAQLAENAAQKPARQSAPGKATASARKAAASKKPAAKDRTKKAG
ncbi:MAG: PhaM family polyhydroxyalkanoate granule multifunctional regulatory protein [Fluviibacter sp.]